MSQRPLAAIVIGCSAGGLNALQVLLGGLGAALPVPVIVVCHSGSEDMRLFCELLQRSSPMPVREAEERVRPRPGEVHVAPSGYHLLLEQNGCFALSIDDRVEYSRPSINVLFESASNLWKETVIAVLMTGANADGARGLATIRAHGGIAIVEDPRSATVPTMPEMALKLAGADHCLPVGRIAPLLENLCKP